MASNENRSRADWRRIASRWRAAWLCALIFLLALIPLGHLLPVHLKKVLSLFADLVVITTAIAWGVATGNSRARLRNPEDRQRKLRSAYLLSAVCGLVTSAVLITVVLSRLPVPVPRHVLWLLAGLSVALSALALVMLALKSGPRR